jgi:hypothetical protein
MHVINVLPRLKLLSAITALTLPTVLLSYEVFDRQGIYLHEPVQGVNLNRRSISGLEPELPVTLHAPNALSPGKETKVPLRGHQTWG